MTIQGKVSGRRWVDVDVVVVVVVVVADMVVFL